MKKFLATILAFIYLSSSMGATIHLHYCMGKLASWGLIDHESKNCTQCGMLKQSASSHSKELKTECCRDEHKQIKTDRDQKLSPSEFFKYNIPAQSTAVNEPGTQGTTPFSIATEYPNTNAPPLIGDLPLFVLYRNFRL
jgi:hypothetical protein